MKYDISKYNQSDKMKKLSMLFRRLVASLLCLQCLPLLGYCQEPTCSEKLDLFLEIAEELFHESELPGVGMAIVCDSEVIYKGGFGYSNLETKEAITENTLFFIGSTTKAFTGFATAKLVEKDLLNWKKPIINYLPSFKLSEDYVTKHVNLEDLFTHMTGLARKDEWWLDKDINREKVYRQTAKLPFSTSFRGTWGYNSHTYVIIGKTMEKVTGKTWEAIIQDEIFNPLGMTKSYVTHQDFLKNSNKVTGYYRDGKTVRPHTNSDNIAPAGGISSTPSDLSKWLQLLANQGNFQGKQVLSKKEYDYLTQPKGMSLTDTCLLSYYSIGWGGLMNGMRRTLRHNGAIAGNNARVAVMPDDGFGIFIMTNQRSEYKDILADYAEDLFVNGDFERDIDRESKMISLNRFIQFQNKLLDTSIESARAYHTTLNYKDFEAEMIILGNSLLDAEYLEYALFVFELNVSDHPNSSIAYYNYANALLENKNKGKAIEMYKRSLALDAKNEAAKGALEKLQKD